MVRLGIRVEWSESFVGLVAGLFCNYSNNMKWIVLGEVAT